MEDSTDLGKYANSYVVDNFTDFNLLNSFALSQGITLPTCTITSFDQEKYELWCQIALTIFESSPAPVCNTILDCLEDENRHEASNIILIR